jgi:hypothetical protein
MLPLVAILLTQVPAAPCNTDGGLFNADCSYGGFRSRAALYYGSGAPDLVVGETDNLPDGGWGSGSKYGLIRTMESSSYNGWHPDLTISAFNPRSAGLLFGVENSYFSPGFVTWATDWAGNVYQHGRVYVNGNGNGLENLSSYAAVRGQSTVPWLIGDVMLAPRVEHHDGGWLVDVWNGPIETPFRVRDDGVVSINNQPLRVESFSDALRISLLLPDGGAKRVTMRWDE